MYIYKQFFSCWKPEGQRALKDLYMRAMSTTCFSYIQQQDYRFNGIYFHQCFHHTYRTLRERETNPWNPSQVDSFFSFLYISLFLPTVIFPEEVNLLVVGTVAKTLQTINCSRSNRRESLRREPLSGGIFPHFF